MDFLNKIKGSHVLYLTGIILIVSIAFIYFIDLQNILGIRDYMHANYDPWPYFWYQWYENGGPIEVIQYLFLGIAALVSIKNSSLNSCETSTIFWNLMGVALMLMLIEDAGDPRHMLRVHIQNIVGEAEQGLYGTLTELLYFTILGSIPLYAVLRYGRKTLLNFKYTKIYMICGFFCYGGAVSASFIGSAFHSLLDKNIYMLTGNYLLNFMKSIGDQGALDIYSQNKDWISFYLMDSPFEESLELLGAALLLAACISFNNFYLTSNRGK